MGIQGLRYLVGNLLLAAGIAAVFIGGWPIWVVVGAILLAGAPADEAIGDDYARFGEGQRRFFDTNIYATLPLLALLTVALLYRTVIVCQSGFGFAAVGTIAAPGLSPDWRGLIDLAGAVVLTGYAYALYGATVGHELVHRTGVPAAQWSARALFAFTFNTAFTVFHIYGHHRQVGTPNDPATAKRGEYILAFVVRTTFGQFMDAFEYEAARLRRRGLYPFGLRNRAVSGQLYSVALIAGAGIGTGWPGVVAFVAAGVIGRIFHEFVNYVQHYGLVRVEGAPIEQRHSWDSYRLLSNALQYNLPRHADHHMFASKPFWQLSEAPNAPMLPHGYQTMVFVALVPSLWRRAIGPLLADWDARLASDAERTLIRMRGWEGRC
jgi:alkane 1-monooxygenase